MPNLQSLLFAAAVALLAGMGLGGWLGHELATGRAAGDELVALRGDLATAAAALGTAREQLASTTQRVAASAARDATTASRHLSEAARYEQVISSAARLGCDRDPGAYRVLLDAVERANRLGIPAADPAGVPQGLRPDAGAHGADRGRADALGAAADAMGRALPDDQPRVPQGAAEPVGG